MNFEKVKSKNILVAGGAGFIGVNLTSKLLELGANVRSTYFNKQAAVKYDRVEYVKADLRIALDCERVCSDIDYVFMCAANSSGAAVIENEPLTHLTPNIIMNAQMLSAAYSKKVEKFIFISSNTVYPVSKKPMAETDVDFSFFEKYYIVGWMKMFSEIMCGMYADHIKNKMNTLVVRPGNIYGPFDKYGWEESKVIAALVRRFAEKQNPLDVWGDGKEIKDFIYISDFIDGLIEAAFVDGLVSPVNIASGQEVTINDVIDCLQKITGGSTEINYKSGMPSMIPVRSIDINKAKNKLDWEPKINLTEGLTKTLEWYRNFYK